MKKISPRTIAIICAFLAAAIWGGSFVTQRIAGEHMGAFTYNAMRFFLGALSLLPVIKLFEKEKPNREKIKKTWLVGLMAGGCVFLAANLQQFGIVLSDSPSSASEAGFITGMYIIFVPLLGLFLGRRARPLVWVSAVMAFAGLALISIGPGGLSNIQLSDILLLICAVFWAIHILIVGHFIDDISPIRFVSIQFLFCAIFSLAAALIFEDITMEGLWGGLPVILFGGIVASGIAYTFQTLSQRGLEASLAAIIFSLEALFAALSEAIFLGETMTLQKYIGGAIIFAGILLSQHKKAQSPATENTKMQFGKKYRKR
ncbi:MAG: DMT family transporter [Defluviitaleaceae bacterium]|nr:DMT family transporter [Defluviitaleaceae bacterium]